jgi:4,5-dihydroxyphthalate decarboxylase
MSKPTITLTCADYNRIMPLASGKVQAEGLDLRLTLSDPGNWPSRAAVMKQALVSPDVAGGEASMGIHLRRIDQGDRSFVALPIFVLRNFPARDVYVRKGSPIISPAQLAGKRIGMYSRTASGSIWYRHFLAWAGLDPMAQQWTIGEIDDNYSGRKPTDLASCAVAAPEGRSLAQMLVAGELDAIFSPGRPKQFDASNGPIQRLLPDYRPLEMQYYQQTSIFPPQHLMVLRRDVWEADRSLARRVTDAFIRCEDAYLASIEGFPYASPWFEQERDDAAAAIGTGVYAHGLDANRKTMEAFCAMGHQLGLTDRLVSVDDYFAEFIAS